MYKEIDTYDGPQMEKGFITVSEKLRIDVDTNEEAMGRFATPGVPFFAFDSGSIANRVAVVPLVISST